MERCGGTGPPNIWGLDTMSTFGISDALCARVPALQVWLEHAFLDIAQVAADAPRAKGSRDV